MKVEWASSTFYSYSSPQLCLRLVSCLCLVITFFWCSVIAPRSVSAAFPTPVMTSLAESFRAPIFRSGPDKDGFSLGKSNNFYEVFGDNKMRWFLPVFSRLVARDCVVNGVALNLVLF